MNEKLLLGLVKVLPRNLYSRAIGTISSCPVPRGLRQSVYGLYAARYGVALEEAAQPLDEYPTLRAFFTRTLRDGLRPLDPRPDVVCSPADGHVAASGAIQDDQLFQVKGRSYNLCRLLQDPEAEKDFRGGSYTTVYLNPSDYHRVHCPVAGEITGYRHLPGTLYPVNGPCVRSIDDLFVINERLTTYLRSPTWGSLAVIMVGALGVGRITVAYDTIATNQRGQAAGRVVYAQPKPIQAGAELGIFHLGSTVVLLCQEPGLVLARPEGQAIKMGEALLQRG